MDKSPTYFSTQLIQGLKKNPQWLGMWIWDTYFRGNSWKDPAFTVSSVQFHSAWSIQTDSETSEWQLLSGFTAGGMTNKHKETLSDSFLIPMEKIVIDEEGKGTSDNFPLIFLLFLLFYDVFSSKILNIFASKTICSCSWAWSLWIRGCDM